MYFTRRNVYYVTKKKQWAFVAIFFLGGGGGGGCRGSYGKKPRTVQEKRYNLLYTCIRVYKFNENRDICLTKQNIYILGNCKQSTWCPVVH